MQIAILSFFHYFTPMFKKRESIFEVEEGNFLSPKFDNDGLITVTTTDSKSGDVLMQGYMNEEALKKTIETKEAHYWSRSRNALWQKGKTSGFVQKVLDFRIDDDQDSLWMSVDIGDGASCHVGYKSCFYRSIPLGPIKNTKEVELEFKEKKKKFDPEKVYKGQLNPTKL
jgi:phosphoribosyl-AMP cyclohydrolase